MLAAASTALSQESVLTVRNAWIAEGPPTVSVNAGYLIIENTGDKERVLKSVTSPAFETVEMHRSLVGSDGTAGMEKQDRILIPANGRIEFKPGDYHLMLFNSRGQVRAGDQIRLSLHFDQGKSITVTAQVRRMHTHQHH